MQRHGKGSSGEAHPEERRRKVLLVGSRGWRGTCTPPPNTPGEEVPHPAVFFPSSGKGAGGKVLFTISGPRKLEKRISHSVTPQENFTPF